MTHYFILPLSNCYTEFEKELYSWFEDRDDFETWLTNTYTIQVCGEPNGIEYIDVVLRGGTAKTIVKYRRATGAWICIPFAERPCHNVDDLLTIIYKHTGHPSQYD